MQVRLSGPRSLAMATVAVLFGWWIAEDQVTTMTHYRALSHDALLAELATTKNGGLATNVLGAIVVVGLIVFGVDLLTHFYQTLWARITGGAGAPPSGEPSA